MAVSGARLTDIDDMDIPIHDHGHTSHTMPSRTSMQGAMIRYGAVCIVSLTIRFIFQKNMQYACLGKSIYRSEIFPSRQRTLHYSTLVFKAIMGVTTNSSFPLSPKINLHMRSFRYGPRIALAVFPHGSVLLSSPQDGFRLRR